MGHLEKAIEIVSALNDTPRHSFELIKTQFTSYDTLHLTLKSTLEPERFAAAWERGQKRELTEIIISLLSDLKDK
jgi:hypothetical protein